MQSQTNFSVFTKEATVDTPSGPRHERLVLGCHADDLRCFYQHGDEYSLYHSFTMALRSRFGAQST